MEASNFDLTSGMCRVFVYGSLKNGHSNHGLLHGKRMVCRDSVEGPFTMYSLGYFPGVVDNGEDAPLRTIYGEVYEVDDAGLASLDLLEGHPTFYMREKVTTNNGLRVWMYFLQGRRELGDREVASGMWRPDAQELRYWGAVEDGDADAA